MNKEFLMKKWVVYLILHSFLVLCACQPTPEQPAITEKQNTGSFLEQAGMQENGKHFRDMDIPDGKYVFSTTGLGGRLSIDVSAEIDRPDVDSIAIYRVKAGGFTQDVVSKAFNCLFDGKRVYAAYDASVDELIPSDGTLSAQRIEGFGDRLVLDADAPDNSTEPKDLYWNMYVMTPKAGAENSSGLGCLMQFDYHTRIKPIPAYNEQNCIRISSNGDTSPEALDNIGFGLAEAKKRCDGFFEAIGLAGEYGLGYSFLVDDTGMGIYSGDGRKLGAPAENYAYRLYYTRVVNGVKCLVNEGKSIDDMSDGIPWPYETVCFTVDRRGLQLCWESPLEIIDTVHTDPVLKPFSEILNTFESMMKIKFEDVTNRMTDGTGRMDITIDTMQLGLVRVREKDGDGLTGLLVPAWIFYGNNRIISEDGFTRYDYSDGSASSWNKEPFPMLVINAVDGTIIDLSNGY